MKDGFSGNGLSFSKEKRDGRGTASLAIPLDSS